MLHCTVLGFCVKKFKKKKMEKEKQSWGGRDTCRGERTNEEPRGVKNRIERSVCGYSEKQGDAWGKHKGGMWRGSDGGRGSVSWLLHLEQRQSHTLKALLVLMTWFQSHVVPIEWFLIIWQALFNHFFVCLLVCFDNRYAWQVVNNSSCLMWKISLNKT